MLSSILILSSSILNILLGFYTLLSHPKLFLNKVFFGFCLAVAGWIFSIFVLLNYSQNILWGQLPFIFASLIAGFLLIFSIELGGKNNKKNISLLLLIPSLILMVLILMGYVIKTVIVANNSILNTFGNLYIIFTSYIIIYIFLTFIVLIYKYLKTRGIEKLRIKYVFLGILAFIIPSILTNLILPTFFNIWNLNSIGPVFSLLMIASISYAIARYHLMDVWVIIRIGAIYTLLLTSITFIYVLFSYLLANFLKIGEPWNFIVPSFFITIFFSSIKKFLELITDKIFFKKKYKFLDIANQIESKIREAGLNLDKMLESVNSIISEALKVRYSNILILLPKGHFISRQVIGDGTDDLKLTQNSPIINYLSLHPKNFLNKEELEVMTYNQTRPEGGLIKVIEEMNKNNVSIAVPIELKGKLIAVYLLGGKKSEDQFSEEDIRLLKHVVWELSFVIDNAKSYEELKKLDEVKSNFISVVSHQLRTPVTTSQWNLELCFDKTITKKDKNEAIRVAYDGTTFLAHQLDQLITVLEIEEKEVTIKKQPANICTILNETIFENKINLKNKKIQLTTKVNKSVPLINCDENKIKKVLQVLVINAINYTMASGKIDIIIKRDLNKKNKLLVEISDDGIGIDEESKNEVFKKFFRAPKAIAATPNGFGLGLFIVKKIVDAHGGEINFEANEKKGTTFTLSLPIK